MVATREWRHVNKDTWPAGPWINEPDKVQWTDEATGLPCLAVRHPSSGHWCGYAGVAEGHPLFNVSYSCCPKQCDADWCEHRPEALLNVHGGITFTDFCRPSEKETGVCHIPEPGQPDRVWWFGFDCAHAGDVSPAYDRGVRLYDSLYRDLQYVQDQTAELAGQLAAAAQAAGERRS